MIIPTGSEGGVSPTEGDQLTLFNLRMPVEYTASSQKDLEDAANDTITERYTADLNNYTLQSNPVAFHADDPNLTVGRAVTYINGDYSYTTRVIRIVRKLDSPKLCEQEITIGSEKIKGTTQTLKEDVVIANRNIEVLAALNSLTESITQQYMRTQQSMLEGFRRISDMWRFDPDDPNTIYSKYNVYSLKSVTAKGRYGGDGSDGSGGGAGSLFGLMREWPTANPGTATTDALGANLGWELRQSVISLQNAGYATQTWVQQQGYLTQQTLYKLTVQRNGVTVGTFAPGSADKAINISDVASAAALAAHVSDAVVHITATERSKWNKTSTDLSAILGTDSDTIINKWEEVIAFLATYTEADTLANLLSNKADKATTLAGYGITDAYTKTQMDGRYARLRSPNDLVFASNEVTFVGGMNSDRVIHLNYRLADTTAGKITVYEMMDGHAGHTAVRARQLMANVATGTAPLIVSSTTLVSNLNADFLDGYHSSSFPVNKTAYCNNTSIYDLRFNVGSYDRNDFPSGQYYAEYPSPYGVYLSLAPRDKNSSALIFIDSGIGSVSADAGHVFINTRKAGDSNTTYNGWKKLAFITDTVANASSLGGIAASEYLTKSNYAAILDTRYLTKATFDDLFEKKNIGTAAAPVWVIHAKYGLYSDYSITAKGEYTGGTGGTGGGNSYGRLDSWDAYVAGSGDVLSADLGYGLHTGLDMLTAKVNTIKGLDAGIVSAGTYTKVTTDTYGRVVAGSTLTVADIPALPWSKITSGKPTTLAGYGIADGLIFAVYPNYVAARFATTALAQKAADTYIELWQSPGGWFNLKAGKFITDGGTASMFVKGDGSLDSNTYLTTSGAASKYLPLTGGILSGQIYFTKGQASKIGGSDLMGTWVQYGDTYLNVTSAGIWRNNSYRIWDSGNDGAGSGLDADMLDGVHLSAIPHFDRWIANPGADANERGNYIRFSYANNCPAKGVVLSVSANNYGLQFNTSYDSDAPLYFRRYGTENDGGLGAWQQLARVTDNVASATKLADNTAFTAWGQTFFANGIPQSISGDMTEVRRIYNTTAVAPYLHQAAIPASVGSLGTAIGIGLAPFSYGMFMWGDNSGRGHIQVGRKDGTQTAYSLILQEFGGNVGIGTTSPAYKLDVNGSTRIAGALTGVTDITMTGAVTSGRVKFGRNGSVMELLSGNNEFVLSMGGSYAAAYINYRTSTYGGRAPAKWVWNAGTPTTYADFDLGALNVRGDLTLAVGKQLKSGTGAIEWDAAKGMWKFTGGIYSDGPVTAKGSYSGSGSAGSGNTYGRYDDATWTSVPAAEDVLAATLGVQLNNRVKTLEGKNYLDALTMVQSGSGNAVTSVALSADKKIITVTKGNHVDVASDQEVTGAKTFIKTVTLGRSVLSVAETSGVSALPSAILPMGIGTQLEPDPTFSNSVGGLSRYNNAGNTSVTLTRIDDNQNSGNLSGKILEICTNGTATPGLGGFVPHLTSRANAVFLQLFYAKIPVGYSVMNAENSMGSGYRTVWLTSRSGTGKWAWYARLTYCGNSGTFSSGGHVYLTGAAATAEAPVRWYLAYHQCFDMSRPAYQLTKDNYASVLDSRYYTESEINTKLGSYYTKTEVDAKNYIKDRTNGTATYLNYGAAGVTTASWLAAWNGYELRAMSPANVLTCINAVSKAGDTMTGALTVPRINASGTLVLNGGSGLYLRYADKDATSLVLSSVAFKPFDAANGVFSLGSASSRWTTLYANSINVTSTALVSNLNADLLDGYHRSNLYATVNDWFGAVGLTKSITVTGDKDTYYPVRITVSLSKCLPTRISVWKILGSTTPSGISGNHSNGTSSMWMIFESRAGDFWDGNDSYLRTIHKNMPYANLVGGVEANGSAHPSFIIWLRGGTCQYYISCTNAFDVDVFYSTVNATESANYPKNVSPITSILNDGIVNTGYSFYGNATSATKLQTARTINGTSFDGSANITTSYWGTARNIYVQDHTGAHYGGAVSVNGSADVRLKLPSVMDLATLNVTTAVWLNGTSAMLRGKGKYGGFNLYAGYSVVANEIFRIDGENPDGAFACNIMKSDISGNVAFGPAAVDPTYKLLVDGMVKTTRTLECPELTTQAIYMPMENVDVNIMYNEEDEVLDIDVPLRVPRLMIGDIVITKDQLLGALKIAASLYSTGWMTAKEQR